MKMGANANDATSREFVKPISDQCVSKITNMAQSKQAARTARAITFGILAFLSLAGHSFAQDPVIQTPFQLFTFDGNSGQVTACAGCYVYSYNAGTNTPKAVYTDSSLATPNTNPVRTNGQGYAVTAGNAISGIWTGSCYKFVAKDSSMATLWTQDNVCSPQGAATAALNAYKALLAAAGGAALIGFEPTGGTVPLTVASALNSFLIDAGYSTFANACAAASGASKTLLLVTHWTGVGAGPFACNIQNVSGLITLSSSVSATFTGKITNPASLPMFDVSASSAAVYFSQGTTLYDTPQWFGALADNSHDDTTAIQAAIDACRGTLTGNQYFSVCGVIFPFTTTAYKVSATINTHAAANSYRGMTLSGDSSGMGNSVINWTGNSTSLDVIHMIGFFQTISGISIHLSSDARDSISYDGKSSIGISTKGTISNIEVECNAFWGNGITGGRGAFQADQVTITNPEIIGCFKGYGIVTLDPNAVSWTIINPSIQHGWVGLASATSSTMQVYGGELDYMQINYLPGAGSQMRIDGVRSEGSQRALFTTVGSYNQPLSFTGGRFAAPTATRQTTTANATATTAQITISQCTFNSSPDCFIPGDKVIIAGAGAAGVDLHAQITGYAALFTVLTINQTIQTTVSGAAVTLDGTAVQPAFVEAGGGPYVHTNLDINSTSTWAFQQNTVGGPQLFEGVSFAAAAVTNPFGLTTQVSCSSSNTSWRGLTSNVVAVQDHQQIQADANNDVTTSRPIYVNLQNNDLGSSNNHIVGTNSGWCYWPLRQGMTFVVELFGISLQAGANDFTYGGNSTVDIFSSRVFTSNIGTGYSANGVITMVFSAGDFHDVSQ